MKRVSWGVLLAVAGLVVIGPSAASAAQFSAYVGCSEEAVAPPSHVCQLGDEPGAFFESSEAEVEYEICVTFPNGNTLCAEEQLAEEGVLYVNTITTDLPGNHLASWYVEGVEVASWSFRIDAPPPPPPASPASLPAPVVSPPPPVVTPVKAIVTAGCRQARKGVKQGKARLQQANSRQQKIRARSKLRKARATVEKLC